MVYPFRKDVFGGLFLISQTCLAMILSHHLSNFTHPRQQGFIRHWYLVAHGQTAPYTPGVWLMDSWFLLSGLFYWFIHIEIITHTYQNSMKWEKTITTTIKTKFGVFSREYFVNMTKLPLLTNLHHHSTLYHHDHVSGAVVRWRRTVLRRRRTSHTVLRGRRTQVLPWRASTRDVVRRRRTRSIIVGLCNDRFLSQDHPGQRRTGPTTAYVDVRRRRTLRESWGQF